MLTRQSRLLRRIPPPNAVLQSGLQRRHRSTDRYSNNIHTSSTQNAPAPVYDAPIREKGMTIEAKERVRAHARKIQSSASTAAASPAVRPQPAQHFQAAPQPMPANTPRFESDGQVKNGLDYS